MNYDKVNQTPVDRLCTGTFLDVKSDIDAPLIIGQMASKTDNSQALMIFAADDAFDIEHNHYNITFSTRGNPVTAYCGGDKIPVTKLEDGTCTIPVSSNCGILLVAE